MATHEEACSGSACLCDALFSGLSAIIPDLARKPNSRSCAIGPRDQGRKFAYVYHEKRSNEISIWCRGDPARLSKLAPNEIHVRSGKSDAWKDFPASFKIKDQTEIDAAVRCLFEEAYSPKAKALETGSGNVFADIGFSSLIAEQLRAKSDLIIAINDVVRRRKLTLPDTARLCGTAQSTLSKVFRGGMESVTIEQLASWLMALGQDVEITVKPAARSRQQGHLRVVGTV